MPPEPQSVIKKATSNGGIEEANLENIDGQIKQGKFSNFKNFLKNEPDAGLEPATVGLKVQRSTDWANQASISFYVISNMKL